MRALLEEQLPGAGPDVAGWFSVSTGDQNMEGKTCVTKEKIAVRSEEGRAKSHC